MKKDIFGAKISYQFVDMPDPIGDEDKVNQGFYIDSKKLILISSKLKGQERLHTIFHEELHALFYRLNYAHQFESYIHEHMVEMISKWITENYKLTPIKKPKIL